MAKGKVMETVIKFAGEVDPSLNGAVKKMGSFFDSSKGKAALFGAAAGAAFVAAGKAAVDLTKKLVAIGDEYDKAMNKLSASTGATGEELAGLEEVAKNIFGANYGENFAEVSDAVALAKKTTGLMGDDLEDVTKGAFALQETFGYDINESLRAAKAMMQNFGVDGKTAMSMIAAGAQNGLDYSGELMDSISEYSVQFKKVGLGADAMFQIFQAGADSGAWNLDKVGDAVKEFSIRAIDGSKTTLDAYEKLGLNADEMMATFAAGGPEAEAAFQQVTQKLVAMEDQVQRDAVGVELFGTMWEDLGVDAVAAMANASSGAYDTKNALEGINDVKYDSLSAMAETFKRQFTVEMMGPASRLTDMLKEFGPVVSDMLGKAMPYIVAFTNGFVDGIGAAIKYVVPIIQQLWGIMKKFIPIFTVLWSAIQPIVALVWDVIQSLIPMLMARIELVANYLSTIGTIIAYAIQGALAAIMPVVQNIIGVFTGVMDFFTNLWTGNWSALWGNIVDIFANLMAGIVGLWKAPVNAIIGLINGAIEGINALGITVPDWVPIIGGKEFSLDIPPLPLFAAGGFTSGPSIAGEAGTEAVFSFDPAYRQQNLAYWAQAGRMLGASDGSLLSSAMGAVNTVIDLSGIKFAPVIKVYGKADKDSIIAAIRAEYPDFCDMLEEWLEEREARCYG